MPHEPGVDKSFTYFALIEAFDKNGCPVCRFMTEYSVSYLDGLLYEQVNDVGIRRKLRDARGFCNWHAWQASKIAGSALGVAIIANDLITAEMGRLDVLLRGPMITGLQHPQQQQIAPKSLRAFIRGWQQKEICPACRVILDHERHALETILNSLHDEEFAHRFERSAPLCILHTSRVAETNGLHPSLRRLIELQRHKYARLGGELEEFCRKHNYRFAHESWGTESDSWLRAIEFLAGKPEVFGNDVHRSQLGGSATRGWGILRDWLLGWVLGGTPRTRAQPHRAEGEKLHPGRRQDQPQGGGKE
jgi:Family of unknown function (DUF6062)